MLKDISPLTICIFKSAIYLSAVPKTPLHPANITNLKPTSPTSNQLHRDCRCCKTNGFPSPQLLTLFSQSANHICCYINTYFKRCWNWSWLCRGCYVRREVQQRNWIVFVWTGAVASELASKLAESTSKSLWPRICWQSSGLSHGHTAALQAKTADHKISSDHSIFSLANRLGSAWHFFREVNTQISAIWSHDSTARVKVPTSCVTNRSFPKKEPP